LFPRRPPGSLVLLVHEESEAAMAADEGMTGGTGAAGGGAAEIAEDSTQVVEYAAAIDVAKGSGMACTRVPGTRPDRRRQKAWRVEATFNEVTALMDHLRAEGIRRLVLESTSDYWRIWVRHEAHCSYSPRSGRKLEEVFPDLMANQGPKG
jgi:hypothetical protein